MSRSPANISQWEKTSTEPQVHPNDTVYVPNISFVDIESSKQKTYTYSDIALNADSQTDDEVRDRQSIIQSVWLIIGTPKRSRWWRPNFGTDLETLLFQPLDTITAGRIKTTIRDGLTGNQGDSRIILRKSIVIPDLDNQLFYVELFIDVPSLGLVNDKITFGLQSL